MTNEFCVVKFQITNEAFYFVMQLDDVVFSKNVEIFKESNLNKEDYFLIKTNLENKSIQWRNLKNNALVYK